MKDSILKKNLQIEAGLSSYSEENISLLGGSIGIAIFYAHLYKLTNKEFYFNQVTRLVSNVVEKLSAQRLSSTFAAGFTGIAWGINYLVKEEFVQTDPDELFEELDNHIYRAGARDLNGGFYDYLHGGLGPVLFALSRFPNSKAKAFLDYAVHQIDKLKIEDDFGFKWKDTFNPRNRSMDVNYNFGLSHGIPSIAMILLKIYGLGLFEKKTSWLINGSLKWMLHFSSDNPTSLSRYPYFVSENQGEVPIYNSRLSWCYGDLTLAWLYWSAGKLLNESSWTNEAITLMNKSVARIDPIGNSNLDAAICHGTAGISYMFKKFYDATGQDQFNERAIFWADQTLKQARFNDGLGGYKSYKGAENMWINNYGLLEGVTGIGLVNLAHLGVECQWDECLLLK